MSEALESHSWYPGELEIWRMKEDLKVSEFAAKHRKVTLGANQGDWDNSITPYLTRIMDSYNLPWVQEIVIVGVPQSGKTNACINMHLYAITYRGGNVKYIMLPKENLAKKIAKDRLIPIYRKCEPVAKKLSTNPDDVVAGRIAFRDGTVVYPVWGSSPSEISSFPADDVLADEVDKNDDLAGKETHALNLMEKRATTFRRPKKIKCSSPAGSGSLISKAFDDCVQQLDYQVVCPYCGHRQQMIEERLTWPGQLTLIGGKGNPLQPTVDHKKVLNDKSARYICAGENCGTMWNDLDRDRAVRLAAGLPDQGWVERHQVERPVSVGFTIDALICPDISLSEYAAAILKARSGDVADQIELDNSYRAKKYEPEKTSRKEDAILALRDDRPEGLVPSVPIAAITCIADMQKRGFWYKITAWGYGLEQESWLLKSGFVDSWEALQKIMFESQFEDVHKNKYIVTLRGMDSGGGEGEHQDLSRTAEAYLFAAANPGVVLFKGRDRMNRQYNVTDIDRLPGSNKALPGSAKLYTLHSTFFKDKLAGKLRVSPTDPGAWHLHQEVSEDFARQMCAEHRTEQGTYECPKGKDNHIWDCSYMELALVEIAQVKIWPQPMAEAVGSKQSTMQSHPAGSTRPGWFNNR